MKYNYYKYGVLLLMINECFSLITISSIICDLVINIVRYRELFSLSKQENWGSERLNFPIMTLLVIVKSCRSEINILLSPLLPDSLFSSSFLPSSLSSFLLPLSSFSSPFLLPLFPYLLSLVLVSIVWQPFCKAFFPFSFFTDSPVWRQMALTLTLLDQISENRGLLY